MNRPSLLLFPACVFFLGAQLAAALTVKPNVAPVVQAPIATQQIYFTTSDIIDLNSAFRDPDASAAVQLTTVLGTMNFTLDGGAAPITVANFLRYVDEGRYFLTDPTNGQPASLFFHRSVSNFVIQSGGFIGTVNPNGSGNARPTQVPTFPAIQNEPLISNARGTIAMAKIGSNPNSATSQWFVNLQNNAHNVVNGQDIGLDVQNGGFTVFGRVAGSGMTVADAIAALPKVNVGSPFDALPVRDYTSPNPIQIPNLVSIPAIARISPLVFTAVSSNPTVATATISGTHLLVLGNQVGSAQITVTATDLDGAAVSQHFAVNIIAEPFRLRNISTRVNFPVGNEVLIGGFIVRGGTSKSLAVRAIGPSLTGTGIANALSDPTLEVRDVNANLVGSNNDWNDGPDGQLLDALHIAPTAEKESALIVNVPSGAANKNYTAIVRSSNGTPGIGLVEVYDLDSGPGSAILNLSTRGPVGTGNNVMIGGFISRGTNSERIVIRALGPSLAQFNVAGPLADPTLELRNAQGALLASNNDWQSDAAAAAEISNLGIAPSDPLESALIATLPSGNYTAITKGNGTHPTGIALIEVYQVP
ncbi:MAG TPA: peptidylprolyl isomerase [Chthoniobacterales bacterium]|nr:peptidylprolyl isomerase [Chthoniobacterales bacterium]